MVLAMAIMTTTITIRVTSDDNCDDCNDDDDNDSDDCGHSQVKLAVSGMTAHRRRNSVHQPVGGDAGKTVADAASVSFAELADSHRTVRRWDK